MASSERLTLTVPEVAKLLGLSENSAYTAIARGDFPLPVIRIGRRLLVPRAKVHALLGHTPTLGQDGETDG